MSKYDGVFQKPESLCKTCTDFKSWAKQQKENLFLQKNYSTGNQDSYVHRTDCPLDKTELGRATWGLLHTVGATYPKNPSATKKQETKQFFESLSKVYPCEYCANDFQRELRNEPVDVSSQEGLSQWLCRMHNKVNKKLDKPLFDCSKVNERWRDGWLDGSCD